MIISSNHPPGFVPVQGSAYRTDNGEVFVYKGTAWVPAKVVFTVFGVAPDQDDAALASSPSPGRNEPGRLCWKEEAIPEDEAWPPAEVHRGVGQIKVEMTHYGDSPGTYFLQVAGFDLKTVEQRWRHVAQTLVPGELWRELEPIT